MLHRAKQPANLNRDTALAVLAAPILLPLLAGLWAIWRTDQTIQALRRR